MTPSGADEQKPPRMPHRRRRGSCQNSIKMSVLWVPKLNYSRRG
jgi:hypothetical protein